MVIELENRIWRPVADQLLRDAFGVQNVPEQGDGLVQVGHGDGDMVELSELPDRLRRHKIVNECFLPPGRKRQR